MTELLIDPNIRVWVFLPIVVITFLVGIIRHYVSMLISSQKKVELTQIQDRWAYTTIINKFLLIFFSNQMSLDTVKRWYEPDFCEKMVNTWRPNHLQCEGITSTMTKLATLKPRKDLQSARIQQQCYPI